MVHARGVDDANALRKLWRAIPRGTNEYVWATDFLHSVRESEIGPVRRPVCVDRLR